MRRISTISRILAAAAGFVLGSATVLSAGVVMNETAVSTGPIGGEIQHRTIYIQGNKQRVDAGSIQTITDLDKRTVYLIDKTHKSYLQLPLIALAADSRGRGPGASIELKRTGTKQVIADQKCEDYRGREGDGRLQLIVSACVSNSARGAKEIARFDRKMLSQITDPRIRSAREPSAGVVLEKKSVLNLRVPGPGRNGFQVASMTNKTRVEGIVVKPLAAQTFAPPKDYSRMPVHPPIDAPDGNLRSVSALHQPLPPFVL